MFLEKRGLAAFALVAALLFVQAANAAWVDGEVAAQAKKLGHAKAVVFLEVEGKAVRAAGVEKTQGKSDSLEKPKQKMAIKRVQNQVLKGIQNTPGRAKSLGAMQAKARQRQATRLENIPVITGDFTSDELYWLEKNPLVSRIEADKRVYAAKADSVYLINATPLFQRQANSVNLTGFGETICVVDSGVDYSHYEFGGCGSPAAGVLTGNTQPFSLESSHPYPNNVLNETTITFPGFTRTAVHFSVVSTETNFDQVMVKDSTGRIVASYSGVKTDFWSPSVEGNSITIVLSTDGETNGFGYAIDQARNGTSNADVSWNCPKVAGGYDFYNSDFDPMDDAGHGTHVAGIASGNWTMSGVAPWSRIAAVKVLGAEGDGQESDVAAGIDWCTSNAQALNISVITLSLGMSDNKANACDSDVMSQAVNNAFENGIFVTVASGNNGYTNGISTPSCATNATPVGSTNKTDKMSSFTNRWAGYQVMAPGSVINSSMPSNQSQALNGTSMATPHVAGAAAILLQFTRARNATAATPLMLKTVLNSTGVMITDSATGRKYYRINVSAALDALNQSISPHNISLSTPQNASSTRYNYSLVNVSFTDDDPDSCIITWSNGSTANYTMARPGNYCSINMTGQADATANFTVTVNDTQGNAASAYFSQTFDSTPPTVNVTLPLNNSFSIQDTVFVNASFIEENFHSCYLQGNLSNTAMNRTGNYCHANVSTPADGAFNITVLVNDSAGNNASNSTYLTIDRTPPTITLVSPQQNNSFSSLTYLEVNASIADANPSQCRVQLSNGTNTEYYSPVEEGYCFFNFTEQTEVQANFTLYANDSAGNTNSTSRSTFLDRTPPAISSVSLSQNTISNNTTLNITVNASDAFDSNLSVNASLANSTGHVANYTTQATQNAGSYLLQLSLPTSLQGNYSVNVTVSDNAFNNASNNSQTVYLDLEPPNAPLLSLQANAWGTITLNWTGYGDAAANSTPLAFQVNRNTSGGYAQLANTSTTSYEDTQTTHGASYAYTVTYYDLPGNANTSQAQSITANDSVKPVLPAISASNNSNGSITINWSVVSTDVSGHAENNASYHVYRTTSLNDTNASNMTSIANLSNGTTSFQDNSQLSPSTTYLYVVTSKDAALNENSSVTTGNSLNLTTVASCTNTFTEFSSCSTSTQSRTRWCLGATQTQTQSCNAGGSLQSQGLNQNSGTDTNSNAGTTGGSGGSGSNSGTGGGGGGGAGGGGSPESTLGVVKGGFVSNGEFKGFAKFLNPLSSSNAPVAELNTAQTTPALDNGRPEAEQAPALTAKVHAATGYAYSIIAFEFKAENGFKGNITQTLPLSFEEYRRGVILLTPKPTRVSQGSVIVEYANVSLSPGQSFLANVTLFKRITNESLKAVVANLSAPKTAGETTAKKQPTPQPPQAVKQDTPARPTATPEPTLQATAPPEVKETVTARNNGFPTTLALVAALLAAAYALTRKTPRKNQIIRKGAKWRKTIFKGGGSGNP